MLRPASDEKTCEPIQKAWQPAKKKKLRYFPLKNGPARAQPWPSAGFWGYHALPRHEEVRFEVRYARSKPKRHLQAPNRRCCDCGWEAVR